MKLVIAEKPSVAVAIANVIGATDRKDGFMIGNGYIVSWCVGHLVSLAKPEEYDKKYSKWKYEDLPIIPSKWLFSINTSTKKQFKVLEKLMKSSEVKSIIEATDAGREGELIFRLVYNQIGKNKPYERLWISSMENSAIEKGFNNLKDGAEYENLYQSALARSRADWLIGFNATRLFTTIYHNKLSVGRVQTPTLALIADRYENIRNFRKEKFYHIELDLGDLKVKSDKIESLEKTNELKAFCEGKKAVITEIKRKIKKKKPPLLFDLTTLQREANRLFGYTAKQTLDYAQSLYEKKLITYPRTDSKYITSEMEESVNRMILDSKISTINPNISRIIDDSKVSDHHAIIQTNHSLKMKEDEIPKNELNIFLLVQSKIFVAVSLDYVYEEISVKIMVEDNKFKAIDKILIEYGFKKIEKEFRQRVGVKVKDSIENNTLLLKLKENSAYNIKSIEIVEGITEPPKYFTEDTLLSAMERAGVEELDKTLDTEKKGLGTPATRAGIIEKIIKIGYVKRNKKNLIITDKGIELISVVPENIKSAKLTAKWENKLTEISNGKYDENEFISGIKNEISELVESYAEVDRSNSKRFIYSKESIGNCIRCESEVYEGKKNFYCSNESCKFSMWKEDRFFKAKEKVLTKYMAKKLLSTGRVKVKKMYSNKKEKYYDATVVLNDTGTWVNYKLEFGEK